MGNKLRINQKKRHLRNQGRKPRIRDYKAEYDRRLQQGLAAGKSPSLARGHRTAAEAAFEPNKIKLIKKGDFNKAFKEYERTKSFRKAAHKIGVSPERFRNQAFAQKLITLEGNRWKVIHGYPKILPIFSAGHKLYIEVGDFKTASKIGKYMNAVRNFLRTQKPKYLKKYVGQSVTDIKENIYVLETNENLLYKIAGKTSEPVEFYDHS